MEGTAPRGDARVDTRGARGETRRRDGLRGCEDSFRHEDDTPDGRGRLSVCKQSFAML